MIEERLNAASFQLLYGFHSLLEKLAGFSSTGG